MKALEQMLVGPTNIQKYKTIDLYTKGTTALYTDQSDFIPSQTNFGQFVVPYGNQTGLGGDTHDTFRIDRYGNTYGGHTTLNIPNYGKIHVPWNNNE